MRHLPSLFLILNLQTQLESGHSNTRNKKRNKKKGQFCEHFILNTHTCSQNTVNLPEGRKGMSAPLRRYAATSDEVEHLDSELSESLAKIRADIEVSSGRPVSGLRAWGKVERVGAAAGARSVR